MKHLWKSLTIRVGWLGSVLITAAVSAPDELRGVLLDVGVPEHLTGLILKLTVIAGAVGTAAGVTYGRARAERKPPLDARD